MTAAVAEVVVDATPADAFRIFAEEIGLWWRRGTRYWNDPERACVLRLEPGVGGRLLEVHDPDTEAGFEVGRVTAWEPGERLALTWTQVGWPDGMTTEVEVTFAAVPGGTRVRLEHRGFERLGADADGFRAGYAGGWRELLDFFARRVPTTGGRR